LKLSQDESRLKVCLIIPLLNEQNILEELIIRMKKFANSKNISIVFVDDGSFDQTQSMLNAIDDFRVLKLFNKVNEGYGSAVRNGLKFATSMNFDWAIIVDSDLSSNEIEIESVLKEIYNLGFSSSVSYIKPSRFYRRINKESRIKWKKNPNELDQNRGRMIGVNFKRSILTNLANLIARILVNFKVSDPTNGFRAIKLTEIGLINTKSNGFDQIVEELSLVLSSKSHLKEIPTILNHKESLRKGTSFSYSYTAILNYLKHLVRYFLKSNKEFLNKFLEVQIFVFSAIWANNTIQNISYRIARVSSDDGIVAHVLAWANPENFSGDPRASIFSARIWASSMNWVPAIFYEIFNIDPYIFFGLFTFLQNFLLPISIFYMAKTLSKKISHAFIVTIAIINLRPFLLNIAWYGDLEWMAYTNWLILPIGIITLNILIRDKYYALLPLFYITFTINPSLGLSFYAVCILYLYFNKDSTKRLLKISSITLIVLFHTFFVFMMIPKNSTANAPEVYNAIFNNTHALRFIFKIDNGIDDQTNLFIIYWSLILIIYVTLWNHISLSMKSLIKSLNIVTLVFILMHYVFYLFKYMQGFILILTRVTILTILLNLIIVFVILLGKTERKFSIFTFISLTILIIPSPMMLVLLILYLCTKVKSKNSKFAAFILLFVLVVLIFKINKDYSDILTKLGTSIFDFNANQTINLVYSFFSNGLVYTHYRIELILFLVYVITFLLFSQKRIHSKLKIEYFLIILTFVFSMHVLSARSKMYEITNPEEVKALSEVQLWVRNNTPVNECIMVQVVDIYDSWRNLARRPVKTLMSQVSFYNTTDYALEYTRSVNKFIDNTSNNYRGIPGSDEALFRKFSVEFDCNLLAWRNGWGNLELPIIYENSYFRVYEISNLKDL
jgi:hypothetical protein